NSELLSLLVILLILKPVSSVQEGALISRIPGFDGNFSSDHHAGYVTIDDTYGKRLYYYLVESESNPSTDPVVLWLNGGPGCSSFDGFVYEHGPFNFEAAQPSGSLPILHPNPHSWSKVSNIIYLDSPAGVGFSCSGNESDYVTGDLKTASDSYTFLLKWFDLYPEFSSNPFFISGESYAGIYVPTLAYAVANGIDAGTLPKINFKARKHMFRFFRRIFKILMGYMVGNGVSDDVFDGNALVPFAHGMGLISDQLFEEVDAECQGNYHNSTSESCETKLAKVDQEIANINIYDILEPCYHAPLPPTSLIQTVGKGTETGFPLSFRMLGETQRPLPVRKRIFGRAWPLRAPVRDGYVPTWPELGNSDSNKVPCSNDEVATAWLNDEEVRKAIHAENASVSGQWELCTDRIRFHHDAGSMIKYHKNLTSRGYRVLIYSGDHDMCVPFTGSQAWTRSLGYKTVDEWRPWSLDDQVAGSVPAF
ncbi:hypothetical protein M569_00619, partial [Genlisea aurea]